MIANDRKSYLIYLNKLVDQYNDMYRPSINKRSIIVDYSALAEKIEMNPKATIVKVNDRVTVTKYKNFFSGGSTKNWSREMIMVNSYLKTNPWIYENNDLNGEK